MAGQVRRCAVPVGANIAEGVGRRTARDFARFVGSARGSLDELEHHWRLATGFWLPFVGMEDLQITPRHVIPAAALDWRFDPSGGPGGQHANRASTRVELRFDLGASDVFDDDTRDRMLRQLGARVRDGVVSVIVDDTRSQYRNRVTARRRLAAMLKNSMRSPTPRRPTRPSRAARERRMKDKRERSETKRLRRRPDRG